MAAGWVPIVGSNFDAVQNQIAAWDRRNLSVDEGNIARANAAEQNQNNYFARLAEIARRDAEEDYQRQYREQNRQDVLGTNAAQMRQRKYEFGQQLKLENERSDFRERQLTAQISAGESADVERNRENIYRALEQDIASGVRLKDVDPTQLEKLSQFELQRLSKLDEQVGDQIIEEIGTSREQLKGINTIIAAQRRDKARREFIKAGEDAAKAVERATASPLEALPPLSDLDLGQIYSEHKLTNSTLMKSARFNPETQQFELRLGSGGSYFNTTTQTGNTKTGARTEARKPFVEGQRIQQNGVIYVIRNGQPVEE